METWFKTQSGNGEHHLQFGTSSKEQYELMQFVARACVDHNDAHLRELIASERDGRCVVMPCKVGDTVYYPYAGRVIPKRITQYREILRKSEAIDRWYCLEFSNDETFDADDIGKSVFLTRAEAEKALGKEQGHD